MVSAVVEVVMTTEEVCSEVVNVEVMAEVVDEDPEVVFPAVDPNDD